MKTVVLSTVLVVCVAVNAAAQSAYTGPSTLLFSTSTTHTTGADVTQTNEGAILDPASLIVVNPGAGSAAGICDFSTWASYLGDVDADGNFDETTVGNLDAAYLLDQGIVNPPGLFDMAMSSSEDFGPQGRTLGIVVRDGDVFQLTPAGINVFLRETQLRSLLGNPGLDVDVDAFAINRTTGEMFISFDATVNVNTTPLQDGGFIVVSPGAYTRSGNRIVGVVPGGAAIQYTEADVNAFFTAAGLSGVTNLSGLTIEPTTGEFWMANDDPTQGLAIVSSGGGGTLVSINGTSMSGGTAFGMQPMDFAGATGSLSALAFETATPLGSPLVFDAVPMTFSGVGTAVLSLAGVSPSATSVFLFGGIYAPLPGGFPDRLFGLLPAQPGNWPEVYGDLPSTVVGDLLLTLGPTAGPDANGLASWSIPFTTPTPFPIVIEVQAITVGPGSILFSTPLVYTIAP